MAKFVFQLQSVLEIKEKMESQEKLLFAAAQTKLFEEIEKLESLKEKKLSYQSRMKENMSLGIDVMTLNECNRGIEVMKLAIKDQEVEVARAQKNADIAQNRLNEAVKERKTYEKLRENAFEEFVQEIGAKEGKEIDELVSYTYHVKSDD